MISSTLIREILTWIHVCNIVSNQLWTRYVAQNLAHSADSTTWFLIVHTAGNNCAIQILYSRHKKTKKNKRVYNFKYFVFPAAIVGALYASK